MELRKHSSVAIVFGVIFISLLFNGLQVSATHATNPERGDNPIFLPMILRSVDPLAGIVYRDQQGMWLIEENGNAKFLINETNGTLSPDGKQIAYWFSRDDEGAEDIWLANITNEAPNNLTNSPNIVDRYPQWWPAREGILIFGTNDEVLPSIGRLTMVDVAGNNYQVLDEQGFGPFALSPDGQIIAYLSMYGNTTGTLYNWGQGIEIFDPMDFGLSVEKIVNPAWSPDGQSLAWEVSGYLDAVGERKKGVAVFDLNAKTSQLFHLYEMGGGGSMVPHYLSWSPNGEWLAFVTWSEIIEKDILQPHQAIVSPTGGPSPNLWLMRLDGQQEIHLGAGTNPVWSPDSQKITYNAIAEEPYAGVWRVELLSGEKQQILPSGATVIQWLVFGE